MELLDARIPYTACPLCDALENTEVMIGDCTGHPSYKPSLPKAVRWIQCGKCAHVYVDGYFGPRALDELFSGSIPNADSFLWSILTWKGANPYWSEIEHYHNFGRKRLWALLEECGFQPVRYGVSLRYRACMEVIATRS